MSSRRERPNECGEPIMRGLIKWIFLYQRTFRYLKHGIREFIDNEVEPYSTLIEESDEIPQGIMEKSKQMGLLVFSIPEEYGGLGLIWLGNVLFLRKLGRTHNGYTTVIGGHTGIGGVGIVEMGNKEQKRNIYRRWPVVRALVLLP